MKAKTCGVLKFDEGCSSVVAVPKPGGSAAIRWNNVSLKFKRDFFESWNESYNNELYNLFSEQGGREYFDALIVLDKIGYLINCGLIGMADEFEDVYSKVSNNEFCAA